LRWIKPIHLGLLPTDHEEKVASGRTASRRQAMAQQVLGGIAEDLSIEGRDVTETQSTFDRLLRAYFARFMVRDFQAMSYVSRSFELPPAPRNGHSHSN
jgi:hypothetical protein